MNEKILIASDSTSDLSLDLIEQNDIKILPLSVSLGEEHYKDGVDINPDMIYAHYEETKQLPKTAALNIAECADFFRKYTEEGYSIVFFTISAFMSSTYHNACLAAEDFPNVHVVDTKNLSTGGGLLVLSACDMRKEGKSAQEIAEACSLLSDCVSASFVIDSLEFLHKGGRCSALAAFGANLLKLKPCIVVKNGKMGVSKKYRGSFAKVLAEYINDQIADYDSIDLKRAFLTHAGCDEEIVEACLDEIKSLTPFEEIYVTRAGCTVSSHCGKNTLGVLFIQKDPLV